MAIVDMEEKVYLNTLTPNPDKEAIYFYTSFCGTCKLGERMLDIIDTMDNHIPIRKMNINYAPQLRDDWQITSVPCLVILRNNKPEQFVYAMHSVDYLHGILKV